MSVSVHAWCVFVLGSQPPASSLRVRVSVCLVCVSGSLSICPCCPGVYLAVGGSVGPSWLAGLRLCPLGHHPCLPGAGGLHGEELRYGRHSAGGAAHSTLQRGPRRGGAAPQALFQQARQRGQLCAVLWKKGSSRR